MKSIAKVFAIAAIIGSLAAAAAAQGSANGPGKPVVPVAWQPADEAASVQVTLNRFVAALAAHDVQQLQAVGVDPAELKHWQKFFREVPDARVTDDCPAPALFLSRYGAAIWNCTETTTLGTGRKTTPFVHPIQFRFARRNGDWTVAERK